MAGEILLLDLGIEVDRALEIMLGALRVEPRRLPPSCREQVLRLAAQIAGVDLGQHQQRQRRGRGRASALGASAARASSRSPCNID